VEGVKVKSPALVAVALTVAGAVVLARPQQATPVASGSGSIAGRVVDAATNQPVEGARVAARLRRPPQPLAAQSGADGAFVINGVPAGDMTLSANKAGYGSGTFGMRAANGSSQTFDLAADEHATGVVLKVWKFASLSGFVTDESGRPAARIEVTALPVGVIAGRLAVEAGRSALTDQQGYYSIPGVPPARYIVTAWAGTAEPTEGRAGGGGARQRLAEYPRLFFPEALSASEATILDLTPGEARNDIDFSLRVRPMVAVSGVVSGLPAGASVTSAELVREPGATGVWSDLSTASAPVSAGAFTFPRVPPGRYVVRVVEFPSLPAGPGPLLIGPSTLPAGSGGSIVVTQLSLAGSLGLTRNGVPNIPLAPISAAPTWWGESAVIVGDSPVTTVSIALQKGARVRGVLAFDGVGARPTADGLLQSAMGIVAPDGRRLPSFQMARLERDSSFTTVGLPPGTYALIPLAGVMSLSGSPPTWPETWTSVRTSINGEDQAGELIHLGTQDLTVTVTLSETPTVLSGTVTDASGRVRPDASVYIFRSDRKLWTAGAPSREVRPNRRGAYRADLPPGEYLVTASSTAPLLWMEAAALEKLASSATLVRLTRGDKLTKDLTAR
jgi:hypothetical protein